MYSINQSEAPMTDNPLVSVVIPYYNNDNEKFLRACFESVACQTYSPVELIVVDDGSTTEASAFLEKFQNEFHFTLKKQENKGVSAAVNAGIKCAKGKYLAFMGADDFWALQKTELQVQFLESSNENVGACCSRGYYVFENNPSRKEPRVTRILKPEELQFENLLRVNCIMAMSVMIKRKVLDEIGLFDEQTDIEDWDMWLRIADKYQFGYIPEPLAYYRRHTDNRSNRFDKKWYYSVKHLLNKWKGKEGQRESINMLELSAINNFARRDKTRALKIAFANPQCANKWLYWRGLFKILVPGFVYSKSSGK